MDTTPLTSTVIRHAVESLDLMGIVSMFDGGYIGRGAYDGPACVAVIADDSTALPVLGAAIAKALAEDADERQDTTTLIEDALDGIRDAHIDTFGHQVVVYWPDVPHHDHTTQPRQ